MWVKFRGHLFNLSHICGISADGPTKSNCGQGPKYYVRIYSSGKCFEVFTFDNEDDRDVCFYELEQICRKHQKGQQTCLDLDQ